MRNTAYKILHVSLGITFLLIGVSIVRSPEAWGSMLEPWVMDIIGGNLSSSMMVVGIVDIVLGVLLILNLIIWPAALIAAIHMAAVLVATTSNFDDLIVRDIGIFGMALSLVFQKFPKK